MQRAITTLLLSAFLGTCASFLLVGAAVLLGVLNASSGSAWFPTALLFGIVQFPVRVLAPVFGVEPDANMDFVFRVWSVILTALVFAVLMLKKPN